jgi:hypothetical protein
MVDEILIKEFVKTKIPQYDYHVATMSLPYLLKIDVTNESFFDGYQYLGLSNKLWTIEPYTIEPTNKLKIGICWQGNKQHHDDAKRSINLNKFYEISQIPGIQLYSLQKQHANHADFKVMNIIDHMDDIRDFRDTARLIAAMHLVISVDTAIVHLSGAICKHTLCLLAYKPDWRWGLSGSKSFWYPSVELIRQKERGNWDTVIEEVKNILGGINKLA